MAPLVNRLSIISVLSTESAGPERDATYPILPALHPFPISSFPLFGELSFARRSTVTSSSPRVPPDPAVAATLKKEGDDQAAAAAIEAASASASTNAPKHLITLAAAYYERHFKPLVDVLAAAHLPPQVPELAFPGAAECVEEVAHYLHAQARLVIYEYVHEQRFGDEELRTKVFRDGPVREAMNEIAFSNFTRPLEAQLLFIYSRLYARAISASLSRPSTIIDDTYLHATGLCGLALDLQLVLQNALERQQRFNGGTRTGCVDDGTKIMTEEEEEEELKMMKKGYAAVVRVEQARKRDLEMEERVGEMGREAYTRERYAELWGGPEEGGFF